MNAHRRHGGRHSYAAVLDAIEGWRFEPATKDGVKGRVRWVIRQTFRLKS
jgi:outer membrane biosynthesis protein TonB